MQECSCLIFAPTSGNPTTTENPAGVKYTVVEGGDPNGVISGISGNSVNLTGKLGRALVKVSYESSFGTVSNYIEIYVSAPYYKIELHKNDNNTLGEQITKPVPLKNVKAGNTYSVWAVVKEYDGVVENGEDGKEIDLVLADMIFNRETDKTEKLINTVRMYDRPGIHICIEWSGIGTGAAYVNLPVPSSVATA